MKKQQQQQHELYNFHPLFLSLRLIVLVVLSGHTSLHISNFPHTKLLTGRPPP